MYVHYTLVMTANLRDDLLETPPHDLIIVITSLSVETCIEIMFEDNKEECTWIRLCDSLDRVDAFVDIARLPDHG